MSSRGLATTPAGEMHAARDTAGESLTGDGHRRVDAEELHQLLHDMEMDGGRGRVFTPPPLAALEAQP